MAIWASILPAQKPSLVISDDSQRPGLCLGHLRHEGNKTYLYCTNSYMLVQIPVDLDCEEDERAQILPEGGLVREGLVALDAGTRFRIVNGMLEVEGNRALFPVEFGAKAPDFPQLIKSAAEAAEKAKESSPLAFNADYLQRLVAALGLRTDQEAVRLQPSHPTGPITVTATPRSVGTGLLMPVRQFS